MNRTHLEIAKLICRACSRTQKREITLTDLTVVLHFVGDQPTYTATLGDMKTEGSSIGQVLRLLLEHARERLQASLEARL